MTVGAAYRAVPSKINIMNKIDETECSLELHRNNENSPIVPPALLPLYAVGLLCFARCNSVNSYS